MTAPVSPAPSTDERSVTAKLLREAQGFSLRMQDAQDNARGWVGAIRHAPHLSAAEALLREYSLTSEEGILLMCLAEALLRIPDARTADALIADKLSPGHWDAHIGLGRPWFVNWAGHGLELAGAVADEARLNRSAGEFLAGLIHRLGEPVVRAALRRAMRLMGEAFVLAEDMPHARAKREAGMRYSFDMLGEGARSREQAAAYLGRYREAIAALATQKPSELMARDGVSVKLSALHPRLELRHWQRLEKELLPTLTALTEEAARANIPLTVDAEEATRLDVTLRLFSALRRAPSLKGYAGLGLAVQAYNLRARDVLEQLRTLAEETGTRIPVRLVKGAYWDAEIKRAQMEGLDAYPVFTRKAHTDVSYLACAEFLLAHPGQFYPQFATHNALTAAAVLHRAKELGAEFEFQRLHGMGTALHAEIRKAHNAPCRIYAPVGPSRELLSYLIRRILENGANASFVHALADTSVSEDALLADPFAACGEPTLPLPVDLYASRKNSQGFDLGEEAMLAHWEMVLQEYAALPDAPADGDANAAYEKAEKAFPSWAATPTEERACILERLADLLEASRDELVALCVREAGKTLADAIAEVREAADFCRYYASEARRVLAPHPLPGPTGETNLVTLHPRGVIVAISPWNFPLAIFTGQVVAALVTGNAVLAKPAEQTPRIAALAVTLMHEAGIPDGALQLVPGSGELVGAALVQHPDCAGALFTGSTGTARRIQRALAEKDGPLVPFIAETGGQNCMVIDSSALIEQTVDDMTASAFYSAGQRCSALRVAFVQEDIADELSAVLAGAMRELRVGDPADMATDIGPIIDEEAATALRTHIARMTNEAARIASTSLPEGLGSRYVAPHAFEIPHIDVLNGEVFGPILHVIRYKAREMENVIAQINSTGYGLTFGIQSRIDATIRRLSAQVRAGNIYVNRAMTGAVVGVQPFGGMGLSGTGPKAGGPHYLSRLCTERTLSVNTAAIGGNIELLARKSS